MSREEVVKALWPINCFYNYGISHDGRCYSKDCMMNVDPILKEKIKKQGCGVFKAPEVQALKEAPDERT